MKIVFRNKYYKYAFIILPYLVMLLLAGVWLYTTYRINNATFIIINKQNMSLSLFNYKGELLQQTPIATGKNYGNKEKKGDLKTPEGIFKISEIQQSAEWKHDFKDDSLGEIAGAYGPYFIRLEVPGQKGIGIHGTHDTLSLGKRASEGCIRVRNEELEKLVKKIRTSTVVIITPAQQDVDIRKDTLSNPLKTINPKSKKETSVSSKQISTNGLKKNTHDSKTGINKLTPKKNTTIKTAKK